MEPLVFQIISKFAVEAIWGILVNSRSKVKSILSVLAPQTKALVPAIALRNYHKC